MIFKAIIIILAVKGVFAIVNDIEYEMFIRKHPEGREKAMQELYKGIFYTDIEKRNEKER